MSDLSTPNKKIKLSDDNSAEFSGTSAEKLLSIENELSKQLSDIEFDNPVQYIYNPLVYAETLHKQFVEKFMTDCSGHVMFLGMNPGPFGMVQNGVPFGEVNIVKNWFGLSGEVGSPIKEHPSRKISGLHCKRSEISGRRFWGLFQTLCDQPSNFFKHSFPYNICPLAFLSASGKNITPAELNIKDRQTLLSLCENALAKIIQQLNVQVIVGIGKFAEKVAQDLVRKRKFNHVKVVYVPHPSPRNAKSKNWVESTASLLKELNLMQYFVQDDR